MLKLKICGLNNTTNLKEILALEPDFIGLNFYPDSIRFVNEEVKVESPENVKRVGVFVNEGIKRIIDYSHEYHLSYIQLHGEESPEFCEALQLHDLKIIKVFRVNKGFTFNEVEPFVEKSEYFLFDAAGESYGGNGVIFNWEILKDYPFDTPYFLAGGLSPENVDQVFQIEFPKLYALDVNSGYEAAPGIKDVDKVKGLIKKMKAHDSNR